MQSTPLEKARNLGPVTAAELEGIGIRSLEQLAELGWEEAFSRLVRVHPERLNLNMCSALAGAVEVSTGAGCRPR